MVKEGIGDVEATNLTVKHYLNSLWLTTLKNTDICQSELSMTSTTIWAHSYGSKETEPFPVKS